jgi:serine protease
MSTVPSSIRVIVLLLLLVPASFLPTLTFASEQIPRAGLSVHPGLNYTRTLNYTTTGSTSQVPRVVFPKPNHTKIADYMNGSIVVVKFAEGTMIRLRNGNFTTLRSDDLSPVYKLLQMHRSSIQRLFGDSEIPPSVKSNLEQRSRKQLADLNLYYKIFLFESKDAVENFIDSLNSLPIVEIAYPLAKPAPAPSTPDFTGSQGYLNSAPGGIGAKDSWSVTGGTGSGVKIVDVEYSWNLNHEDLSKAGNALMKKSYWGPSDPFNDNNHGTAVLGELIADDNGFGVTGIAKGAAIGVVPSYIAIWGYVLSESVQFAADNLQAGDVILIELQMVGPNGGTNYVPVEWDQGVFDAIQYATAKGIVVVEAGGNGAQNLDDPIFQDKFNRNTRDSGAIIVGAGYSLGNFGTDLSRASFSTYGSRVDVQGWGDWSVTTAGYGTLYSSGGDPNTYYTSTFSGTSSASAMVAGAAADLESVIKAVGGSPGSPSWIRERLVDTGAPQSGTQQVGPRPNLLRAETSTITVYSIDLQFMGQDPASQNDLRAYIYNNNLNLARVTTYSFSVDFNTEVTLSVSSNPNGWSFANWWEDYGFNAQYNQAIPTIDMGTSDHKIAAFFTRLPFAFNIGMFALPGFIGVLLVIILVHRLRRTREIAKKLPVNSG